VGKEEGIRRMRRISGQGEEKARRREGGEGQEGEEIGGCPPSASSSIPSYSS
jgi:hypothetical protein